MLEAIYLKSSSQFYVKGLRLLVAEHVESMFVLNIKVLL